jgi:hypothetical protein
MDNASASKMPPVAMNFGRRAAKASILAAVTNFVLLALSVPLLIYQRIGLGVPVSHIPLYYGLVLLVIGFVSGVVAIGTMHRYGRNEILLPAITGLVLNLVMSALFYIFLGFVGIFSTLGGRV